jgi:CubicO group peptidase (beta-lactamase class C family)
MVLGKTVNAEKLDQYLRERTAKGQFSGVVLISRGPEALFAGSYGFANRGCKTPNTMATRFDTASITKLFTAVATLQLVDRGDFNLDQPVIPFLELTDTVISRAVTVRQLLTHTSGIGDDAEEEEGEDYSALWVSKPNYSVTKTRDFLPQFIHKPANFPPGEGCRYCNCGYVLLGLMIEKTTGLSYRDYVRENVFKKAGMSEADFFWMNQVNENVAEGCDPVKDKDGKIIGWEKNIYAFPPVGSPDGGAYVTAYDLVKFIRSLQAGELLSPSWTRDFFTPQVYYQARENWTLRYGYGLVFYEYPAGKLAFFQKEGINPGCSGYLRVYPERDLIVVILSNMADGVWEPIWNVHDLLIAKA